jgi:pyrroline-5-carboxylate reductase
MQGGRMKIAILGSGVMGRAFAKHFAKQNSVTLCDRNQEQTRDFASQIGATYQENIPKAVKEADVILLAVKPKDLTELAKEIAPSFAEHQIVMSILAGVSLALLQSHFPKPSIVRSMPNLAILCGQGVMGLAGNRERSVEVRKTIDSLLDGMGLNVWMEEEKLEALTAISGSGIGFVLVMMEAMIDGGVHLGFSAQDAREFVLKTMEGAVALMRESGKHPAELKLQISSPGGTTIAGLKVMEEQGVRSGIMRTMIASYERALNMMKNK